MNQQYPQYPQGQYPQGQYPQGPYGQPPKRGLGTGATIAIVLACLFGGCMFLGGVGKALGPKQPTSSTSTATPAAKAAAPSLKTDEDDESTYVHTPVTAGQLIADYEGNEVRGDNAWKGQRVAVTGVVRSVDKGPLGGLYVVVVPENASPYQFHSVHVNLKKGEESSAASLNKGEKHTFKGKVQGFIVGSVSVRDAVID